MGKSSERRKDPSVVATLPTKGTQPYSCIALSPDRQYAILSTKDILQLIRIQPSGLKILQNLPVGPQFNDRSMGRIHEDNVRDSFVRDALFGSSRSTSAANPTFLVITDVAWSKEGKIAAAASNGIIVVWKATELFEGRVANPEGVLRQHGRAINRLAWHPSRGLLLSASQDGTISLWEHGSAKVQDQSTDKRFGFFGNKKGNERAYAWHCRMTFEPKSDAVRDVQWSPFYDDVFGLVTKSGTLAVYNMHVRAKTITKKTAHAGEATALDWHPTQPHIIATGGAEDRCVKIWDLELELSMESSERYVSVNSGTSGSRGESIDSSTASDTDFSNHSTVSFSKSTLNRNTGSTGNLSGSARKGVDKSILHVLSVAANVTRVKWRPPSGEIVQARNQDRHDPMLAISTTPIKGASAGGSGFVSLWSFHRPNMALSVVEGHRHGAVTDFQWLETPQSKKQFSKKSSSDGLRSKSGAYVSDSIETTYYDLDDVSEPASIWQHVISVGRDGSCVVQSFARGDMPFKRVPSACFAMANLSPFQKGSGSLQLFTVVQPTASSHSAVFELTGLRRDAITAQAPGLYKEAEVTESITDDGKARQDSIQAVDTPDLVFNVIDQGDLVMDGSRPSDRPSEGIMVAPEVVHLSRFADQYVMYPDAELCTRERICLHNAQVADGLRQPALAHVWYMLAHLLRSSGSDDVPDPSDECTNVMQFTLAPTIRAILEERAESGDVQTCVVLCEIFSLVTSEQTVRIPDLEISLIREWYYTYIDLLRDMCLFSQAAYLISNAKDPFIGEINQQSTTIHEACSKCGKPINPGDTSFDIDGDNLSRRACRNCSTKVGRCFLCHEVVKDLFVWCSGCSHGGHVKCALSWFGGSNQIGIREVCPTGCGHRCNLAQDLKIFPRTESLKDVLTGVDLIED